MIGGLRGLAHGVDRYYGVHRCLPLHETDHPVARNLEIKRVDFPQVPSYTMPAICDNQLQN